MTYLWLALKVLIYHAFAIYLYPTQEKGQKDRSHVEITRNFKILHKILFRISFTLKFLANFIEEKERTFGVLRLVQMLYL